MSGRVLTTRKQRGQIEFLFNCRVVVCFLWVSTENFHQICGKGDSSLWLHNWFAFPVHGSLLQGLRGADRQQERRVLHGCAGSAGRVREPGRPRARDAHRVQGAGAQPAGAALHGTQLVSRVRTGRVRFADRPKSTSPTNTVRPLAVKWPGPIRNECLSVSVALAGN